MNPRSLAVAVLAAVVVATCLGLGLFVWRGTGSKHPGPTAPKQAAVTAPPAVAAPTSAPRHGCTPDQLAALGNTTLVAFLDINAKDRVPGDFPAKLPQVATAEEIAAVLTVLKDTEDKDFVRNEAVNLLRRSNYDQLGAILLAIAKDPKESERFRAFAVQQLGIDLGEAQPARRSELATGLRPFLDEALIQVRREALLALVRISDPEALSRLGRRLDDPWFAGMRDLGVHCLNDTNQRGRVAEVRPLAFDQDQDVRIAAIFVLGAWGDAESAAAIEEAVKSTVPRLRQAGEMAKRNLAKATITAPPGTTPAAAGP